MDIWSPKLTSGQWGRPFEMSGRRRRRRRAPGPARGAYPGVRASQRRVPEFGAGGPSQHRGGRVLGDGMRTGSPALTVARIAASCTTSSAPAASCSMPQASRKPAGNRGGAGLDAVGRTTRRGDRRRPGGHHCIYAARPPFRRIGAENLLGREQLPGEPGRGGRLIGQDEPNPFLRGRLQDCAWHSNGWKPDPCGRST